MADEREQRPRRAPRRVAATAPPTGRIDVADLACDGLGFGLGLCLAWWFGWQTADLIWGLWLSSLVIGYTLLVLGVVRSPGFAAGHSGKLLPAKVGLVLLFTVHFGIFHLVHSMFLQAFFTPPAAPNVPWSKTFVGVYGVVLTSYWPWLLAAALAERRALLRAGRDDSPALAQKPNNPLRCFDAFAPYRNVARMHALIVVLMVLSFLRVDDFVSYTLVYATYFFPWRLLRGQAAN